MLYGRNKYPTLLKHRKVLYTFLPPPGLPSNTQSHPCTSSTVVLNPFWTYFWLPQKTNLTRGKLLYWVSSKITWEYKKEVISYLLLKKIQIQNIVNEFGTYPIYQYIHKVQRWLGWLHQEPIVVSASLSWSSSRWKTSTFMWFQLRAVIRLIRVIMVISILTTRATSVLVFSWYPHP